MEEGNHGGIDASKGDMGPSRRDVRLGCNLHLDETSMNAIQPEIEAYGRTPVVATLVGGRFLIALLLSF